MTQIQMIIIIAMCVLGTMLTRFLPFIVIPSGKPVPKYVQYLGKVLPGAALGLLVIYCFKGVDIFAGQHGIPELISLAVIMALHILKRNMLLSIAAGTVCYILLVNFVFV